MCCLKKNALLLCITNKDRHEHLLVPDVTTMQKLHKETNVHLQKKHYAYKAQ